MQTFRVDGINCQSSLELAHTGPEIVNKLAKNEVNRMKAKVKLDRSEGRRGGGLFVNMVYKICTRLHRSKSKGCRMLQIRFYKEVCELLQTKNSSRLSLLLDLSERSNKLSEELLPVLRGGTQRSI